MINYFQILDCSNDLGNCCSDYGLANILDTLRKILELLQIIVPILLIVMATVQFTKLVASPDAKDGVKSLINKFMAAGICFFIPTFVNIVLTVIPSSGVVSKTFQVSACWQKAKKSNALIRVQPLNMFLMMVWILLRIVIYHLVREIKINHLQQKVQKKVGL